MQNLPILQIVKQSLLLPVFRPVPFLKPLGILFGLLMAMFAIFFSFGLLGAFFTSVEQTEQDMQRAAENMSPILPFLLLALFPALLMAVANVFNFGVRVGAFDFGGARFPTFKSALAAAGVNGLKFIGIGIFILIIVLVLFAVLSLTGIGPGFMEQMEAAADNDIAALTRAQFLMNILVTLVSCVVYSVFSSNLTQTALGSDKEGMVHPYNVDFAIILFLIYMVVLLPVTAAGLMGSAILMQILNFVLGLWVAVAVGVAHGIRYRFCATTDASSDAPEESV